MIKVKEVMTTDVITVLKTTAVAEAVTLLVENNITGLPVVEEDMTLVGMLTEKDVLRLLCANEYDKNGTVEDFMTRPAIHFGQDEPLNDISDCLMTYDFRRVPITSGPKLVGIVSRHDILRYMLRTKALEPVG
jgi:CBS domain-containing protein